VLLQNILIFAAPFRSGALNVVWGTIRYLPCAHINCIFEQLETDGAQLPIARNQYPVFSYQYQLPVTSYQLSNAEDICHIEMVDLYVLFFFFFCAANRMVYGRRLQSVIRRWAAVKFPECFGIFGFMARVILCRPKLITLMDAKCNAPSGAYSNRFFEIKIN